MHKYKILSFIINVLYFKTQYLTFVYWFKKEQDGLEGVHLADRSILIKLE